jgi:hypothetical protein
MPAATDAREKKVANRRPLLMPPMISTMPSTTDAVTSVSGGNVTTRPQRGSSQLWAEVDVRIETIS